MNKKTIALVFCLALLIVSVSLSVYASFPDTKHMDCADLDQNGDISSKDFFLMAHSVKGTPVLLPKVDVENCDLASLIIEQAEPGSAEEARNMIVKAYVEQRGGDL